MNEKNAMIIFSKKNIKGIQNFHYDMSVIDRQATSRVPLGVTWVDPFRVRSIKVPLNNG